jgi:hypothetical protein
MRRYSALNPAGDVLDAERKGQVMSSRVMSSRALSRHRQRATVSLSLPAVNGDPVEQLDRAIEIMHRVTRGLPETVLGREELIALGGLLTQISDALLTFTELLIPPAHHYDRTRGSNRSTAAPADPREQGAISLLRDCRDSYLAASTSARAFHADIRR